ncbi:restriction endonuclease subunit S [Clostridium perfringens]|nr:restriction endonuclease subunit S [Clostridium perfringens]
MKKEAREGYKFTELGEIPNEWNVGLLGDKAYIKARIGWRGLTAEEYTNKGPLLIAGKHIKGSSILWDECDHISKERYEESSEIKLINNDIIMTKDGTIGRVAFIDKLPYEATINGTMMLIRPNNEFYSKYLYFYFQGNQFQSIVREKISGSSVPHIFQRDLVNLKVPVPTLEEQKKIAKILSTVDKQMENIEKLIQKNQELKKGLMQQLLTKGIGHTEFKKTELGYIPKEWEIKKLKEISEVNPRKDILEDYKLVSFIGMEDIDSDGELINKKVREYVSVKKGYTAFRENDVLLAKITPCFENGKRFLARGLENKIGFGSTEFHVLRASEKINSYYLYYIINSYKFKTLAENNMIGSAGQKRVPTDFIKEYELIVPTKEEQEKIVSILSNIDKKVKQYKNKKYKLEILKKGLMQKLLTGAIKV